MTRLEMLRSTRSGRLAMSMCAALVLAVVVSAQAFACYGENFGVGVYYPNTQTKGVKTTQDLYSRQPTNPNTTTIVHPVQMKMETGPDFVGWGTMKGKGLDPQFSCDTYTGTRWILYADGYSYGQYFCTNLIYGSTDDVASNQVVEIRHTSCGGLTRWALFWNNVEKNCVFLNGVRGFPSAGGESVGSPQEVDTFYGDLQYRVLGGSWTNWNTMDDCVDPGFDIDGSPNDWLVEKE